jgi:3'-phosphoadenosine 5'-phosphosulfate sulfotransferase
MTTIKIPKTLGACADRLYELKDLKRDASARVDAIEAEVNAIKAHIIETLPKSESTGVAGKNARVSVVTKEVPQVKDWEAFWGKFNKKTDTDILAKSINKAAIQARWDAGKQVAGVEKFTTVSVSLNKV